ncbi:MAG: hypothetical protein DRP75_01640 [Candidatus Omnitrophota bacterium]|nr:MAG: hypothetical protein DRP75_01640 [Candidatus Omnitrophota bacterium]
MNRGRKRFILFLLSLLLINGCGLLSFSGQVIETTGKVVSSAFNLAGKTIVSGGKIAVATGEGIGKVVSLPFSGARIRLEKEGDTLFVQAVLNRRVRARLIVDTGCTDTQISEEIARALGINLARAEEVGCELADGSVVRGRKVILREIKVGRMRAHNVEAIVLEEREGNYDGLLGMSFLSRFVFKIDPEQQLMLLKRKK